MSKTDIAVLPAQSITLDPSKGTVSVPDMIASAEAATTGHADALALLRACKDDAEFRATLGTARTLVHNSDALDALAGLAGEVAKRAHRAAQAHETYVKGIMRAWCTLVPTMRTKAVIADLAREITGDDSNTTRVRIGRQYGEVILTLAQEDAHAAAKAKGIESPPTLTAAEIKGKANRSTGVGATRQMAAQIKAGQDLTPAATMKPEDAPKFKPRVIVKRAEALATALGNVDGAFEQVEFDALTRWLATIAERGAVIRPVVKGTVSK